MFYWYTIDIQSITEVRITLLKYLGILFRGEQSCSKVNTFFFVVIVAVRKSVVIGMSQEFTIQTYRKDRHQGNRIRPYIVI